MPEWKYTINVAPVFHSETLSFEERRDAVARTLRASSWVRSKTGPYDNLLPALVDELADTEDADEFDSVWGAVYDEADTDRAWIKTR
jgi:hypothetical protein